MSDERAGEIASQGSGASSATTGLSSFGSSPQAVSPLRASIPSAATLLFRSLDGEWRSLKSLRLVGNARYLVPSAHLLKSLGLVEAKLGKGGSCLVYRLTASAIEARRAETGTGSVHESAVSVAETPVTPCKEGNNGK